MSTAPPNILLVVLDAARRDALEPYGAPAGSTPAIAELAARGHALPLAYSTSSWTLPSHASLFTGRLPRELGLAQAPDGSPAGARPVLEGLADRLLSAVLRGAGYATHGFSANLWASEHAGFDTGFDSFTYVSGGRNERLVAQPGGRWGARLAWALEGARAVGDDGAAQLGRALRGSIAKTDDRPAFWFVNLTECHSPYLPPRPWNDLSLRGRVRAALEAQRDQNFEAICLHIAGHHQIDDDTRGRMRHLYGRAIAYMDAWLAAVLETLERRGILDQTLVIVTADHGEEFGERGLMAHGFGLSEPLIHVPLVLAGPGARGSDAVFSLAGLPSLVARAAGVDNTPFSELAGPAVAQYDAIAAPEDPRIRLFASRHKLDDAAVARLTTSYTAAVDGRRKLVVSSDGGEQRYDLHADPEERVSVADDSSFASLRAALERASAIAPPAAPRPVVEPGDEERAALERQMKLLGYL